MHACTKTYFLKPCNLVECVCNSIVYGLEKQDITHRMTLLFFRYSLPGKTYP